MMKNKIHKLFQLQNKIAAQEKRVAILRDQFITERDRLENLISEQLSKNQTFLLLQEIAENAVCASKRLSEQYVKWYCVAEDEWHYDLFNPELEKQVAPLQKILGETEKASKTLIQEYRKELSSKYDGQYQKYNNEFNTNCAELHVLQERAKRLRQVFMVDLRSNNSKANQILDIIDDCVKQKRFINHKFLNVRQDVDGQLNVYVDFEIEINQQICLTEDEAVDKETLINEITDTANDFMDEIIEKISNIDDTIDFDYKISNEYIDEDKRSSDLDLYWGSMVVWIDSIFEIKFS